jgi:hypothetical protein
VDDHPLGSKSERKVAARKGCLARLSGAVGEGVDGVMGGVNSIGRAGHSVGSAVLAKAESLNPMKQLEKAVSIFKGEQMSWEEQVATQIRKSRSQDGRSSRRSFHRCRPRRRTC